MLLAIARGSGTEIRRRTLLIFLMALCWVTGCSTPRLSPDRAAPFEFEKDTFAYANDLTWDYHFDSETGEATHVHRTPKPEYTLHCFVVARSVRQFYAHARFEPDLAPVERETYRELARQVISNSPRRVLPVSERVVIPGYGSLRAFSADYESILKEACGGAWQSYFQRGHWRMILPFTKAHQERMARQLAQSLETPQPLVVHAIRFPSLAINHALVLYGVEEKEDTLLFKVYDPNVAEEPTELTYDRKSRRFLLGPNSYFKGGRVDIYRIFHSWRY